MYSSVTESVSDAERCARLDSVANSVIDCQIDIIGRCRGDEPCVHSALKGAKVGAVKRNLGGTAVLPSHVKGTGEPFSHLSERKC